MTLDIALLKRCIGWTPDTWSKPLASFLQEANIDSAQHALEIGAGAMSSLSPYLTLMADQVLCSYYDPQFLDDIKTRNAHICKHANPPIAEEKITYQQLDVTNLPDQQWDIIVMKSILGGVFREDLSSFDDATHLLRQIREKNLTTSGKLILIENGKSILEPLLKNHGARKNHWRFFENDSFPEACYHGSFGVQIGRAHV